MHLFFESNVSSFLIFFALLDGGLCVVNIICEDQSSSQSPDNQIEKKVCTITTAISPLFEPTQQTFSIHVDYAQPSEIEVVYIKQKQCRRSDCDTPSFYMTDIFPELFKVFPNLAKLGVKTNLSEINSGDFNHAINLTSLHLDKNNLKIIKNTVFAPQTNETLLNPDGDDFPLRKLLKLWLEENLISEIEPNSFYNLKSLNLLSLSKNELTIIRRETFAGLAMLECISLDGNKIETIEDGALDLPALLELDLSENKLKRLSDAVFNGLPKLEDIWLEHNDMEHFGQSVYRLKSVKECSLEENRIVDIDLVAFAQMPNLRVLTLTNSGFKFDQINVTDSQHWNSSLTTLRLGNNGLSDATQFNKLKAFPNLNYLNIKETLEDTVVGDNRTLKDILPSLKRLYSGLKVIPVDYVVDEK